ncbi:MAG: hypothetical protein ACLTL8_00705 [Bifidobacterium pseudocatenulatum]
MLDTDPVPHQTFSWGNLSAAPSPPASSRWCSRFRCISSTRGLDTLQAGAMLAVVMGLGSIIAGSQAYMLASKFTPVGVVQLGLVIEIIAVAVIAVLMPVEFAVWWWLLPTAYGCGRLASAQLTSVVLSEVPTLSPVKDRPPSPPSVSLAPPWAQPSQARH